LSLELSHSFRSSLQEIGLGVCPLSIDEVCSIQEKIEKIYHHRSTCMNAEAYQAHSIPIATLPYSKSKPVGLNTVGMLVDRLTILCIKVYFEELKTSNQPNERLICQINDIERAISIALPGFSSDFSKITTASKSCEFQSANFLGMSHELAAVNTCLWLAQDVLYLRGPQSLPDSELRKYIIYFADQNIRRNWLIEATEKTYWN
jgi:hypothetical protein